MSVTINGYVWEIIYTHNDNDLMRSDGTITLGVTDLNTMCIYIYDHLSKYMQQKVMTHELVHAWIFSYGIYLSVDEEEFICSFIDTHGRDIIKQADQILCTGVCKAVF